MTPFRFEIPSWPPSVNHSHISARGRRFRSDETKKWVHNTALIVRSQANGGDTVHPDAIVRLRLQFFGRWLTTDKRAKSPFRQQDVSNLVKVTEDAVADALNYNDSQNFVVDCRKIPSEEQKIVGVLDYLAILQDVDGLPEKIGALLEQSP